MAKAPTKKAPVKKGQYQQVNIIKKNTALESMPSVHPQYKNIKVVMTDGEIFDTRSTYGQKHDGSDVMKLDVDRKTHPAWTKQANYINQKSSEVAKFNDKYGGLKLNLRKPS
jgi:large subunit ribosomal protein L31